MRSVTCLNTMFYHNPHGVRVKRQLMINQHAKYFTSLRCFKVFKKLYHRTFGCRRGDKCKFCHPQHCPTSFSDKSCYDEDCLLVHTVGLNDTNPKSVIPTEETSLVTELPMQMFREIEGITTLKE